MLFFKSKKQEKPKSVFAYAQINARLMPDIRGVRFEEPLTEALAQSGLGRVTGAGTMMDANKEITYCGIDIDLFDVEKGAAFVCQFLTEKWAPRGSALKYTQGGKSVEIPFGVFEGLAIYLNGTDLPAEVYSGCTLDAVIDGLIEELDGCGAVVGDWQGPTETGLYMYGRSAQAMREGIAPFVAAYPLCQKSRVVQIA